MAVIIDGTGHIDMKNEVRGGFRDEFDRFQDRKRIVYLVSLACGMIILLLSLSLREPGDTFVQVLYPIYAVLFAVVFVIVWREFLPLWKLEIMMFVTIAVLIMSRLAWHFHCAESIDKQLLVLAGGHYWAVGALVVAGFVMLDYKQGLRAGLIIILLSIIIAGISVTEDVIRREVPTEVLVYLLRVHLFLMLFLGLTSAATVMRQKLQWALIRAEVLDQWASTDLLTDLANRRAAEQFLKKQASVAGRHGRRFSIIFADVDHFKQLNDTYGHAAGDDVLAEIARILTNSVRESDFVARWGGDEFLMVAPEIAEESAQQLAERCRSEIDKEPVAGYPVTLCFGVTEFLPEDNVDTMLARADEMLYKAKAAGRNHVFGGKQRHG